MLRQVYVSECICHPSVMLDPFSAIFLCSIFETTRLTPTAKLPSTISDLAIIWFQILHCRIAFLKKRLENLLSQFSFARRFSIYLCTFSQITIVCLIIGSLLSFGNKSKWTSSGRSNTASDFSLEKYEEIFYVPVICNISITAFFGASCCCILLIFKFSVCSS